MSFSDKIKSFFADRVHQRAMLLGGCAVLAVTGGLAAAFAFDAGLQPPPSQPTSAPVSVSVLSDSKSSSSVSETISWPSVMDSSSGSNSVEEEKEPVEVKLQISSATQDLNVNVVDKAGARVTDVQFMLRVLGLDKHNNDYDYTFEVDARYGSLYLSWIPEGNYRLELQELEGYIVPEAQKFNVKKYVVKYEMIEDIDKEVVDDTQVDASKDDNAFGGGGNAGNEGAGTNTPPPTTTDTVTFVDSSKKEGTEPLKDSNGNLLYTYTYEVGPNGYLLLTATNAESDVKPVVNAENVLTHGLRQVGTTAGAAPALVDEPAPIDETGSDSTSGETSTPPAASSSAPDSSSVPDSSSAPSSDSGAGSSSDTTPPPSSDSGTSSGGSLDTGSSSGSGSTGGSDSSPAQYAVTFTDLDGKALATVSVTPGGTAAAPQVPELTREGKLYRFKQWSSEAYKNVEANATVQAVYDIFETVSLFNADNTPVSTYKITATQKTQTVWLYTGWQTIDGKTYYYTDDHKKVTGWQVIQGISYFFNNDGVRSDCMGIDVSRWNGTIDWKKVKEAGIDFAIIRVGYRGYGTGKLVEDSTARTNLAGATAAGVKVGVYVFSQAINQAEAVEEASMALSIVKGYKLDYPIFIDSEYSTSAKDGRADNLATPLRTAICEAFCKTIANSGYKAGVYASKSWFQYQLDVKALEGYHIWLAHYTTATDYARRYDMWQYTATASVPGIKGDVDMNFSYLNY